MTEPHRPDNAHGSAAPETTVAMLRDVTIGLKKSVSLKRVVRQRLAMSEMCAAALLQPSLDSILAEACRYAADGCQARFAKVLEHRAEEHMFVVRAGWGWNSSVIGHARAGDQPDNPAGEAFRLHKPVTVWDVRARGDYHLPHIYSDHGVISSANVPVTGSAGFYGVLEVDHPTERHFDVLDTTFLMSIAAIIGESVERMRRESALRAAYTASALLLREHYHRVRNDFQTILGLVQIHARDASTTDSRNRIEEIGRRIFNLSSLYDHLLGTHAAGRIELNGYMAGLCDRLREFYRLDERPIELTCTTGASSANLDVDTCTTVGIILNELVANALEHAFPTGGGRIEMIAQPTESGDTAICVQDDGCGFQGTAPAGIGLAVARRLASWTGGSLSLSHPAGGGTRWTLVIPKKRAAPQS